MVAFPPAEPLHVVVRVPLRELLVVEEVAPTADGRGVQLRLEVAGAGLVGRDLVARDVVPGEQELPVAGVGSGEPGAGAALEE